MINKKNKAACMKSFYLVSMGAIEGHYAGYSESDVILKLVQDAGYTDINQAADVIGISPAEFIENITVTKVK